jgi:SAM-dependent methyltransferase
MSEADADAGNAKEIAYWNGTAGRNWTARQEEWDSVVKDVTAAAIARAAVQPGERVVDIGCGCGGTTLELGKRVGPQGRVLGLDISTVMLARAVERTLPGLPIKFIEADATIYQFPRRQFDLLFSRFGVMFFADPARSFTNMRTALRPGGRLAFACWRPPKENPWMMVPLNGTYLHVPPLPKPGPEDPGPYSFANTERVRRILGAAGFQAIEFQPFDVDLDLGVGRGLDSAVGCALSIGATSRAIEGQPQAVLDKVAVAVRDVLAPYRRGTKVPLAASVWLVSALSPA